MSTETVPYQPSTSRSGPRTRNRVEQLSDHLIWPTFVWLVHVITVQLAASLSYRFGSIRSVKLNYEYTAFEPVRGEASSALQVVRSPLPGWQHWIVEPFRNWDGTWYAWVAESGYRAHEALTVFFPLYPWAIRYLEKFTGMETETSGWVISHVAFWGALVMTYKLIRMDFPDQIARWSIMALAIFPTAFFFSAVYSESLFLMLSVSTLWAARKNDWLLAVLLCFLAVLTRSAGMMLGLPLAVLFVQQHGWNPARWFPKALLAVIPASGIWIFGKVLTNADKAFFDWNYQQWQWNRWKTHPGDTLNCVLAGCETRVEGINGVLTVHPVSLDWIRDAFEHKLAWSYLTSSEFRYLVGQSQVMDVIVTFVAIALVLIGLRKSPLYYSAWVIPPLIVPLFAPSSVFPLMSMPRFVLTMVPLFVVACLLLRGRRKLAYGLAIVSILLLIFQTSQFALWYWVA